MLRLGPLLLLSATVREAWSLRLTPADAPADAPHVEGSSRSELVPRASPASSLAKQRKQARTVRQKLPSVGDEWPAGFPKKSPRVAILVVGQSLSAVPPVTTTTTTTANVGTAAGSDLKPMVNMGKKTKKKKKKKKNERTSAPQANVRFAKKTKTKKKHALQRLGSHPDSNMRFEKEKGRSTETTEDLDWAPSDREVWRIMTTAKDGGYSFNKRTRRKGVEPKGWVWNVSTPTPWYVPPDFKNATIGADKWFSRLLPVAQVVLEDLAKVDYWPWASFLHYVYKPMTSSLGQPPDVFLCHKDVTGPMPPEVTDSFDIKADNQHWRSHFCYKEVINNPKYAHYDYYVKIRPDFVFSSFFPDVTSMHPGRFHSRFRVAFNMGNLTSAHLSWLSCTGFCDGSKMTAYQHGYTNDDMVFVAPSPIADKIFMNETEAWALRRRFKWPETWLTVEPNRWETLWAKGIAAQGVVTESLAVRGYARDASFAHSKVQRECLFEERLKTFCGKHHVTLGQMQAELQEQVRQMNEGASLAKVRHGPRRLGALPEHDNSRRLGVKRIRRRRPADHLQGAGKAQDAARFAAQGAAREGAPKTAQS